MTKLILTAALLLILLIGAEYLLDSSRENHRQITQTVRSLPGNEEQKADAIRAFSIQIADTTWQYAKTDGNWHYPQYQNVLGLNDRIKRFLEGVVESRGTVVAFDRTQAQHYGFNLPTTLAISLTDSTASWIQNIQIGRSLPGRDANESFMAVTDRDTLFHMHTDPRQLLSWEREPNRPPLIDPKVVPSALARRAIKQIVFTSGPVSNLERIEVEPEDSTKTRPQDGPIYEWYGQINGKRQKVVNGSVYAYLSFINRLKYDDLHPKSADQNFDKSAVILIDDDQIADTLQIGGKTPIGHTYVQHRTTGQILSVSEIKANLLFPTATVLDTLPKPSPYDKAQPTGPFSLASP